MNAIFDSYADLGIRSHIFGHVISKSFIDTLPFVSEYLPDDIIREVRGMPVPTTDEYLAFSREAFATRPGRAKRPLRYTVAPSDPQRVGTNLLDGATERRSWRGSPRTSAIHVLETKTQLVTGEEMYGRVS